MDPASKVVTMTVFWSLSHALSYCYHHRCLRITWLTLSCASVRGAKKVISSRLFVSPAHIQCKLEQCSDRTTKKCRLWPGIQSLQMKQTKRRKLGLWWEVIPVLLPLKPDSWLTRTFWSTERFVKKTCFLMADVTYEWFQKKKKYKIQNKHLLWECAWYIMQWVAVFWG